MMNKIKEIEKIITKNNVCHITPRLIRHKWLALYSIGLLLSHLLLGISYYSGDSAITENPEIMSKNIIFLTNTQREQNELSPLRENDLLARAAQDKLNDMFTNNYWDHFSPAGKKPWDFIQSENYKYLYAGENLAKGFLDSGSTVDAWMDSESHKNNILSSRYQEIGVAVGSGKLNGKPTTLVVQMFGSPQADTITPRVAGEQIEVVSQEKLNSLEFKPSVAGIMSRLPFLLVWFVIFGLIVFDGVVVRRCGLHASRKHMFEFRSALLINALVLIALSVNIVAIT